VQSLAAHQIDAARCSPLLSLLFLLLVVWIASGAGGDSGDREPGPGVAGQHVCSSAASLWPGCQRHHLLLQALPGSVVAQPPKDALLRLQDLQLGLWPNAMCAHQSKSITACQLTGHC